MTRQGLPAKAQEFKGYSILMSCGRGRKMKQCLVIPYLSFERQGDRSNALAAFLLPSMLFVTDVHPFAGTLAIGSR